MSNQKVKHNQIDKWILAGIALTAVYCLLRLFYIPLISNTFIMVLVLVITGILSVFITFLYGRPCETFISPIQPISRKMNLVWCREKSNRQIGQFFLFGVMLIMYIDIDTSVLSLDSTRQRHLLFDSLTSKITVPILLGWSCVRQIELYNEWLWVKIVAFSVFPLLFILDFLWFLQIEHLVPSEDREKYLAIFILLFLPIFIFGWLWAAIVIFLVFPLFFILDLLWFLQIEHWRASEDRKRYLAIHEYLTIFIILFLPMFTLFYYSKNRKSKFHFNLAYMLFYYFRKMFYYYRRIKKKGKTK